MLSNLCDCVRTQGGDVLSSDEFVNLPADLSAIGAANI